MWELVLLFVRKGNKEKESYGLVGTGTEELEDLSWILWHDKYKPG